MSIKFNRTPLVNNQQIFTVKDATEQLPVFNDTFRGIQDFIENGGLEAAGYTLDPLTLANWNRNIRDGVVNVGGKPTDIRFFTNLMGGPMKSTDATDLTIKYNNYTDFNIIAAADCTYVPGPTTLANAKWGDVLNGTYTGSFASFAISQSNYSNDGKDAPIDVGNILFIYDDAKEVQVVKIDKTNNYAWVIYVVALDENYPINIRAGRKLLPAKFNMTSGYSDIDIMPPSSTWKTQGYLKLVQPFEVGKTWQVAYELGRAYQDIVNFPLLFDIVTGQEIDTFDFMAMQTTREEHEFAKNIQMFVGERIKNSTLSADFYTQKYKGFDGLMTTLWYGGGNIRTYDNSHGFDMDSDYTALILEMDSLKIADEYLFLMGKPFKASALSQMQTMYKGSAGNQTFESFSRSGAEMGDIKRFGVDSYDYLGNTVHMKEVSAWSDKRGIGNGYHPNMGILMPGYGQTDSNGQQVAPVEQWIPKGRTLSGNYAETWHDDMQSPQRKTQWSGGTYEQFMMSVNGVELMYSIMPTTVASV